MGSISTAHGGLGITCTQVSDFELQSLWRIQLPASALCYSADLCTKRKYFKANLNHVPLLGSVHLADTLSLKITCKKEFSAVCTCVGDADFNEHFTKRILRFLYGSSFKSYLLLPWLPAAALLIPVWGYYLLTLAKVRLL